ncbi:MAG: hypothetical protein CMM46_06110 [Rhodospirillaceae bacterium]|nr:hypothetical protein [Rhodospirillaceae bacterium]
MTILAGRLDPGFTANRLMAMKIPMDWEKQASLFFAVQSRLNWLLFSDPSKAIPCYLKNRELPSKPLKWSDYSRREPLKTAEIGEELSNFPVDSLFFEKTDVRELPKTSN